MTAMVSAIYAHGKIELLEIPAGIHEGKVRLIVIEEIAGTNVNPLTYGKYRKGTLSTEVDFTCAEWREPQGWNDADGK